jgi:hypothetical protein
MHQNVENLWKEFAYRLLQPPQGDQIDARRIPFAKERLYLDELT